MSPTHIILGQIVTEKSERLKAGAKRVYTLRVAPRATKIDIKGILKQLYDVDVAQVRMIRTQGKSRQFGRGQQMEKRHPFKKALVTITAKSKPLDLAA